MGRSADTAGLLKKGHTPDEIAAELKLSLSSVMGYLDRAVGEGLIRRSDIYFSFPAEWREQRRPPVERYADARTAYGDMYEDLHRIETRWHHLIRSLLAREFGETESGWWRRGIPEGVRLKCQERRERDVDEPCEPYCYTDLLDLSKIIEDQWALVGHQLPRVFRTNRRQLKDDLARLNRIRNRVMHPVRGVPPSEQDFAFVRDFERNSHSLRLVSGSPAQSHESNQGLRRASTD